MRRVVFGLIASLTLAGYANAAPSPPGPSPTATATAGPNPSPSVPATSTPKPIVPPRDAPPVRSTTPPFAPATTHGTAALPDNVWLGNSQTIGIPIATHAERPFIQVLIDGHQATLVIDTAATSTMVDPLAMEDPASGVTSLQIGDLRFPHLQPVRSNIRTFTETYLGETADGIIGRDLLQRYPVALDFPNRTLTIFRDSRAANAAAPAGGVAVALRVIDGAPAIQASLDGQLPLWFALRTGAGYQLQLEPSADHASRYAHAEHSLPFQEATPVSDATGTLVRAHSLVIGSLTFNQPLVALLNLRRGQSASELVGSLGATLLSRLSLVIDEPSGSLTMVASPGATSARLYDPSGITLMMRRGGIIVRSVAPGTPADAAHVRPGDEIVSINGLAPAKLEYARQLLDGNPGARVAIAYRRWRIVHYTTLTLHVII